MTWFDPRGHLTLRHKKEARENGDILLMTGHSLGGSGDGHVLLEFVYHGFEDLLCLSYLNKKKTTENSFSLGGGMTTLFDYNMSMDRTMTIEMLHAQSAHFECVSQK